MGWSRAPLKARQCQIVMLDPFMRRLIDPPLNAAAQRMPRGVSANQITLGGLACGFVAAYAVAAGMFWLALALLLVNRLGDGLDGALARRNGATDLGAYLDIVADFLFWAILPLGFALYHPQNALASAVLLSSFAMSMTVFLAFAILAQKRGLTSAAQGRKSFFYLAGLAEGTETIIFFAFVMLWPQHYITAAYIFAAFVYLSTIGRITNSTSILSDKK